MATKGREILLNGAPVKYLDSTLGRSPATGDATFLRSDFWGRGMDMNDHDGILNRRP